MLSRFLDWLDEAAAGLIRVAYLLAGITAVAVYFGAGHLPQVAQDALDAALPWVLAAALEIHTYLTARRVRGAWQDLHATSVGAPVGAPVSGSEPRERSGVLATLRVNLGVLAFLVAFSAWNQLQYLAITWRPPQTALALPGWAGYLIRALVVPAAFLAAAFLAPLAAPIAAQIEQEARATLADVFTIARKQRRTLLRRAEREGRDMTRALVELVTDAELRRVIAHAYAVIAPTATPTANLTPARVTTPLPTTSSSTQPTRTPVHEAATGAQSDKTATDTATTTTAPVAASQAPTASFTTPGETPREPGDTAATSAPATDALPPFPTKPPTGEGTPVASKRKSSHKKRSASILRLAPPASAEERIRAALADDPQLSIRTLAKVAGVSDSTASKYRRLITAEATAENTRETTNTQNGGRQSGMGDSGDSERYQQAAG